MQIRNIRHKGLRNFVERNNARGLPAAYLGKISDIMMFLVAISEIEEVFDLQKYKPHSLSGTRAGTYSFHVTANWRITFSYDPEADEIIDLDYEDYH
ncbi:MAG: type II toxin-antitoxin system RelE/ParE family toxin [Aquisalinus sp.]|nr:type II toxin-antitoxin system RelE/ParE family toxin [Aquisalinus sp.]